MNFLAMLVVIFVVDISHAVVLDGVISKTKTVTQFTNSADGKKYSLVGFSPIVSSYLNQLSNGDFVSLDVDQSSDNPSLVVRSINYIGLKAILGTWTNSTEPYCFNFYSHNQFKVTLKGSSACKKDQPADYTYIINPGNKVWVILISGEYSSYVGDITRLTKESLEIDLYDSETGDILRKLNLRKLKSEQISSDPASAILL